MSKPRTCAAMFTLLVLLVSGSIFAESPPVTQPSYTRRQDIVYGRLFGTALTMDVFKPIGSRNGAILVFVCSGGWISSHDSLNGPMLMWFVTPFVERGYVVCAVVHACQPKFTIAEITPQIDRAVKYVRANARDAGLDPDRIGIYGGSAGGHLSLMQGMHPSDGKPSSPDLVERASGKVQAVAVLFPPTDFLNWGEKDQLVTTVPTIKPFLAAFDFRELSAERGKFVDVGDDRRREMMRQLSPINHVTKDSPPTLIIHGDSDQLVPPQQSKVFAERMKEAGAEVKLVLRPDSDHGWIPIQPEMDQFADWFDAHLLESPKK